MLTRKHCIEAIGWTGAISSVTAYTLNSHRFLESSSLVYLAMNLCGCLFLIIYTYNKRAYANALLNSIMLFVTLLAVTRLIFLAG